MRTARWSIDDRVSDVTVLLTRSSMATPSSLVTLRNI